MKNRSRFASNSVYMPAHRCELQRCHSACNVARVSKCSVVLSLETCRKTKPPKWKVKGGRSRTDGRIRPARLQPMAFGSQESRSRAVLRAGQVEVAYRNGKRLVQPRSGCMCTWTWLLKACRLRVDWSGSESVTTENKPASCSCWVKRKTRIMAQQEWRWSPDSLFAAATRLQ